MIADIVLDFYDRRGEDTVVVKAKEDAIERVRCAGGTFEQQLWAAIKVGRRQSGPQFWPRLDDETIERTMEERRLRLLKNGVILP
jgi:uncharacterized membrane protein